MRFEMDLELVFSRDIAADDTLHHLDELFARCLPRWSKDLKIRLEPRNEQPREGPLRDWVVHHTTTRGETYRAMVDTYGGGDVRRSGSVELRGSGPEVVVVVDIDSEPLRRMRSGKALLGNGLAVQVRRAKVEGRAATEWAYEAFERLCAVQSPYWGSVRTGAEYQDKVMSKRGRIEAVGRDFSRYLPGLFAANHFGPEYVDLIGRDRLLGVPSATASPVGDGVQVTLSDDPTAWDSPEYRRAEEAVLDHVGREYFYDAENPDRDSVAPGMHQAG
jgi:hypothetical protein